MGIIQIYHVQNSMFVLQYKYKEGISNEKDSVTLEYIHSTCLTQTAEATC